MRRVAGTFASRVISTTLIRAFPVVDGVAFSFQDQRQARGFASESGQSWGTGRIGTNILLFCPRSNGHQKRFEEEYPKFIRETAPDSVSVTDVAHHPENNTRAIQSLIGRSISPSMIIPHFVLIGHNKRDTDERIEFFREAGIETMLVIRGNPTTVGKDRDYTHHPDGYEDMSQLMRRIKQLAPNMRIFVAGYPEKHPFARNFKEDMDDLQRKVDCGADGIVAQHCFTTDPLVNFLEECERRKITIPVMPSIMPLGNPKYLFAFTTGAKIEIPAKISEILSREPGLTAESEDIKDEEVREQAVEYTAGQVKSIIQLGAPQITMVNLYAANNIRFLGLVLNAVGLPMRAEISPER